MDKIDPNHDIVPTLRMMDGLLFDKAADEIERLREVYRAAVRRPATELMVVGPGWHERHKIVTTPFVIDGILQVHTDTASQTDEVQRLRDALKPFAAIDLTTNQAVDAMDVLRARRALEGGE